jgi:EAL domain-containing protein (putative c-di-GMP-specific phosphodiesterase class I)
MSIAQTIISLTHALNRKVVAEGVETREQVQLAAAAALRPVPGLSVQQAGRNDGTRAVAASVASALSRSKAAVRKR